MELLLVFLFVNADLLTIADAVQNAYNAVENAAFLGDGSICVVVTERYIDQETQMLSTLAHAFMLPEDGSEAEHYDLGDMQAPWATIVIDCFHIMQLCGDGLGELRMKLKRAAVAELKRQEREFKNRLARNQKQRKNYRKKHPKKYKGKVRGPKPMRKNTRFTPPKIELEVKGKKVNETKVELLTHVRYPLMKSRDKWTERQKAEMEVLFKLEPRIETAYNLVHRLRCLFKSKITPEEAKPKLDEWCKDVGKSLIRELISVRDTIRQKETEILNYFINRSTNASAESLNSKIKGFRAQLRGIQDLPFFMYRLRVLFG